MLKNPVKKSDKPLRLNVGYLYNKPIGTTREKPVDFDQINIDEIFAKNLESLVRVSRTREGLLLQVKGDAAIKTECVLCLEEFFLPVHFEFEELYEFPNRIREETDLILPADGYIDLSQLYREYLILGIPIKSVCKPDCKGLCEICGANLNTTTCEHYPAGGPPGRLLDDESAD